MDVKEKVLSYLLENKGNVVSGSKLAEILGVSRTAVWKAVQSLEESGYNITASTKKGYCLSEETDILSPQSVKLFLPEKLSNIDIQVFQTIDSTNNYAKTLANQGKEEMTVIISEEQTAGKGRRGRTFHSPHSKGIYMSVILRPKMEAKQALLITTSTAVAVAKAIEEICGLETKIKWVNDIFSGDKKLCGILTEATMDFESGGLEYAVVGIGVNIYSKETDFPEEIKNIATSIYNGYENKPIRSKLIAKILENLFDYSQNLGDKLILEDYKKRSFLIGENIYIINDENKIKAKAIGINDQVELMVQLENGEIKNLNSGEVSVRFE